MALIKYSGGLVILLLATTTPFGFGYVFNVYIYLTFSPLVRYLMWFNVFAFLHRILFTFQSQVKRTKRIYTHTQACIHPDIPTVHLLYRFYLLSIPKPICCLLFTPLLTCLVNCHLNLCTQPKLCPFRLQLLSTLSSFISA